MGARIEVLAAAVTVLAVAGCDRTTLAGRRGELVIVVSADGGEQLLTEAVIAVPDVPMGDEGTSVVRLRNRGLSEASIEAVTPLEGDPVFDLPAAAGTSFAPGEERDLTVVFSPPGGTEPTVAAVTHQARLGLSLGGTRPELSTLRLELVGRAVNRDCFVPARIDFGEVLVGTGVTAPLLLSVGRTGPVTTTFAPLTGPGSAAFTTPSSVEVGAGLSVAAPITFRPDALGPFEAAVTVQRGPTCAPGTIQLTGVGSGRLVSHSPPSLDLGALPVGDTSVPRAVELVNHAGVELPVAVRLVGEPDVKLDGVAPSVARPGATSIPLRCAPSRLGPYSSTLTIDVLVDPPVTITVPVTCLGGGPRISVRPSLQLGRVARGPPGGVAAAARLVVTNVGTASSDPAMNLRLGVDGKPPMVTTVGPSGGPSREFTVRLPSSYRPAVGVGAGPPFNTIDLDVEYRPLGDGDTSWAIVRIHSNDVVRPVAEVVVEASTLTGSAGCQIAVDPPTLSFGDLARGTSAADLLEVFAPGIDSTCRVSVGLAPGSSPVFSLGGGPVVEVTPGSTQGVKVTAAMPADAPTGSVYRGHVRMVVEDQVVAVPLEVRAADCLVVDPRRVDLGRTAVGCSSEAARVTARNTCAVPLAMSAVTMEPPGAFAAPTPGGGAFTIPPFGATVVPVTHVPLAPGPAATTLTFSPVDEGGAVQAVRVPVTAEGLAGTFQVDSWNQAAGAEVDILFVVDDSGSMGDEQASLAANFDAFIAHAADAGTSFHLGVITTDVGRRGLLQGSPPFLTQASPDLAAAFGRNVQVGIGGSGLEQPLEALRMAVRSATQGGTNSGFLREGVPLAAVLVTDAVEQSPDTVERYVNELVSLKKGSELLSISVVGPFSPPSATCLLDSFPDDGKLARAAELTGGITADICTSTWGDDLGVLGQAVLSPRRRFRLASPRDLGHPLVVSIDGVTQTAFRYERNTNSVVLDTPPPPGATVTVEYRTPCL